MRNWIACCSHVGQLTALIVVLLPLAGCDDKSFPAVPPDEKAISELVDAWNGLKDDPKSLSQCFAKETMPPKDQLQNYRRCTLALTNRPSISGTSVVVPIEISMIVGKEQKVTTLDWTFEKEGDAWKIKAAPLP